MTKNLLNYVMPALCKQHLRSWLLLQVPDVAAGDSQQALMQEESRALPGESFQAEAFMEKLTRLQGLCTCKCLTNCGLLSF